MASTHHDLGFHLRELASRLDGQTFQALSPGIGLGKLQPRSEQDSTRLAREPIPPEPMTSSQAPSPVAIQPAPLPLAQMGRERRAETHRIEPARDDERLAKPKRSRFAFIGRSIRRSYCYAIDLALVIVSLGLALAAAALALTFGEGNEEFWFDGGPMAWLVNFAVWELAAIVGGVFALYLGVFRLIAGRTFGESLAFRPGKNNPVRG